VLEVACGTGYWSAAIAEVAATLIATDASEEVLAIARAKGFERRGVELVCADAWRVDELRGDFDAGFAGFWWSHIQRQQLATFLTRFHGALRPGARVVFADNRFVSGSSTPLSRTDAEGNTWQLRRLKDGSSHEVLKNFPTREELVAQVEPSARAVEVIEFDYFWCLSYELR
jgi:demethylmenaquinone methyltransferase/2-methoxy-6-polyprenyl-1,4-benzoquinol methylase